MTRTHQRTTEQGRCLGLKTKQLTLGIGKRCGLCEGQDNRVLSSSRNKTRMHGLEKHGTKRVKTQEKPEQDPNRN